MRSLTQTAGHMVVHIGLVPGWVQEQFIHPRIKSLQAQGLKPTEVVVMHLPDNLAETLPGCVCWPEREGLWNHNVTQQILKLKPRLVIIPSLVIPSLHEAERQQFLENVATILETGSTIETSLSVLEIARVNNLLDPQVPIPADLTITGDFLRAHVGDYVLHDTQPDAILTAFYRHEIPIPPYLRGHELTLFNLPNLVRLRESMLKFVSGHMADMARRFTPTANELGPQHMRLNIPIFLRESAMAAAGNLAWLGFLYLLWTWLYLPLPAATLLLAAAAVVTAIYVNPLTALLASLLSFVAYNSIFLPSHFPENLTDPAQAVLLVAYIGTCLIVSFLANREHLRRQHQAEESRQFKALLRLAYDMSHAETVESVVQSAVNNLRRTFNVEAAIVDKDGLPTNYQKPKPNLGQTDLDNAYKAVTNGNVVSSTEASPWLWCPLSVRRNVMGAVGLRVGFSGTPSWNVLSLLHPYADIMSTALMRMQLKEASDMASQDAERESLRSALLSAVSHDLKTPLVSIIGSLSTLRKVGQGLPDDDRNELLDTAAQEAERLHSIIHNVLELTRLESGTVQPRMASVDVSDMLETLLTRCHRYYPQLKVAVKSPPPLPWVETDPLLMEEVMFNLIDNAAKYAGTDHPLELEASLKDDMVKLVLSDHGPGIAEEHREKVFSKYFRSTQKDNRQAGSGLGLAISRAIVEACHGTIVAEARADGKPGAAMVLTLPHSPAPLTNEENDHD